MTISVAPLNFSATDFDQPCKDWNVVRAILPFNGTDDVLLDLSALQSTGHFDAAQTLYINNVHNSAVVDVVCQGSNQEFQVPIGGFIYMPLLQTNPPKMLFSCTAALNITVHIVNFFLPPFVWGPTLGGGGGGGASQEIPVDHSGAIAVGGTPQIAIPANALRAGFIVSAPDTNPETLYMKLGVGGGQISLVPGASYETGNNIWMGDIYVVAASNGTAYTAYEG